MEPKHMSPTSPDDSRLEELLRQPAAGDLPDDGFSPRVLAALPPRRGPADRWRVVVQLAGVAGGAGLALRGAGGFPSFAALASAFSAFCTDPWAVVPAVVAVVAAVIVLAGEELGWEL
jgi:hypothetical protein